jgi:outer membrane protein
MHLVKAFFAAFLLQVCVLQAQAQDSQVWSLQKCVQYAVAHNISIQQNELNTRLERLALQQSRLSQLPNLSASASYGRSLGRSIDPTTNQFVNGDYDYAGLSGNADVLLFGWFQLRRQIARNRLSLQAAYADLDQLKDDVSLNVATGFLRTLLAQEQIKINQKQAELSFAQLQQTRKFNEAGRLPELDVAQMEAQVATDSANLIAAMADYNAAVLDMKALLNLDFSVPFEVAPPPVTDVEQVGALAMTPEAVYTAAADHFGSVKSNTLKLAATRKAWTAAKGRLWPQLVLSAQAGSNYASTYRSVTYHLADAQPNGSFVTVGGNSYDVYQPVLVPVTASSPLKDQLNNNFRQTISLSLNIPLFNAWQGQLAVRQAQVNIANQELTLYQVQLNLRQNVYKAYNDARNSFQKYSAAKRAAEAAERAYVYADKRYAVGMIGTVDYLTTQNNRYKADANWLSAKYDLIFRLKVLDYYLGKELTL